MKKLIYDRPVNRGLLDEGITLSAEAFSFIDQRFNGKSGNDVILSINDKVFSAKLNFSISRDGTQKIYQVKYSKNSELAQYFQQIFQASKYDIENQSSMAKKGQRIKTRIREYFRLYATDDIDFFEGETINLQRFNNDTDSIQQILFDAAELQKVIAAYKEVFVSKQWPEEKYKWGAVKHFQDNWDIDAPDFAAMLKNALAKTGNLLVSVNNFPARMITEFAEVAPEQMRAMFKELFDETLDIWQRVKSFKEKSQPLLDIHGKNAKNHYQGENTIFTYLWLRYPEKYYIYKISELKTVAETLHSNLVFQNGKYEDNIRNFLEFYDAIRQELLKDDELKTLLKSQLTDDCYADEALCTLTIDFGFYISRRYNNENDWYPADYDPGFSVKEWKKLLNDSQIFNTGSLEIVKRLLYFREDGATCTQLANKFGETTNFYKNGSSALAERIVNATNCPVQKREDGSTRWWAVLYLGKSATKKDAGSYLWKLRPELAEALEQVDLSDVKLYANGENEVAQMTANPMIAEFKKLLLSAKQIILTGAPGTGKTYLAKQVAYALTGDNPENCPHIEFCQFHPSFDYTDFVEGLRPVDKGNGNIGFERKDGIFKAFCKKAIGKSVNNFDEAYNKFSEFLSENYSKSSPLELKTPNNASFRVFFNTKGSLSLLTGQKNEVQGSLTSEKIKTFLTEKPYEFWAGYYLGVIDYLKKNFNLTSIADNNEQKYVFIIDEINRGDISKIFGELFYAVDPGYRGQDGKVKTQYSNLISEDDPYHGGFYIPKNVYIIGTMNDIDRSVESMDFAIRRRFTWKEIKAQDRVDMWDGKIDQWKADAGKRMNELNAAISLTDSLNDAFHIGPAYFLKLSEKGYNFETLWDLHIQPLLKEYLRGTVNPENDLARLQDAYNLKFIEKTPEIAEQPATES